VPVVNRTTEASAAPVREEIGIRHKFIALSDCAEKITPSGDQLPGIGSLTGPTGDTFKPSRRMSRYAPV